jgi:TolB-like protein
MIAMDWERLIPDHPGPDGRQIGTKEDAGAALGYLQDLSAAVEKAADEHKCLAQAMREIKFPKYEKWANYDAYLPMPVQAATKYVLSVPVSKDALMQAAWPRLAVEEGNLTVQIAALRRVLGVEPGADRWIETLPRRGYRFVGPVANPDAPVVSSATTNNDQPSIAVLPFQNLSDESDQQYFVDGMVEEIATALSRIKWLFVIDRNSTSTYKGNINVRQVAHELGVRYILEGSVRKSDTRVRIAAQLIEAVNGANLWAERFDTRLEDIFQVQDDIASSVAGAIEPTLEAAEVRRSVRRPTTDLTAYALYLRAHVTKLVWRGQRNK